MEKAVHVKSFITPPCFQLLLNCTGCNVTVRLKLTIHKVIKQLIKIIKDKRFFGKRESWNP